MLSFTLYERQRLGLHGLLPPVVRTPDEQQHAILTKLTQYNTNINRFIYLNQILELSEKMFYKVIGENLNLCLPILGPPTVDVVCKTLGLIWKRPKGLFITILDKGHIYDILCNWPVKKVKCICITDGASVSSRMGDIGALAMGVAHSKTMFYTAIGKIPPEYCLPIMLDVGTNNEELLKDPLYIGIRRKRANDAELEELVEEFMEAAAKRFTRDILVHFEDFDTNNSIKFYVKYSKNYCVISGEVQGVSCIALAALLAAQKATEDRLSENNYLIVGPLEKCIGIGRMLVKAMKREGLRPAEARQHIWFMDAHGIVTIDRPNLHKLGKKFAKTKEFESNDLLKSVKKIKPTVLVGVSDMPGIFTPDVIKTMYEKCTNQPIIFALSNPSEKAECTASTAFKYTEGKCIFVSGSPSEAVEKVDPDAQKYLEGKEWCQINSNYIIPAVLLGITASGSHLLNINLLYIAAQVMASNVTDEELEKGRMIPAIDRLPEVSVQIAAKVAAEVYRLGWATQLPEPQDKAEFIRKTLYSYEFDDVLAKNWKFKETTKKYKLKKRLNVNKNMYL